jgi:LPXTG-site transpeptidase (sortase) family protein
MKEENNDFLRQFFKENNILPNFDEHEKTPEKNSSEKKGSNDSKTPPTTEKTTRHHLPISKRDINLKKLFETIEEEKKNHFERIKQSIHKEENKNQDKKVIQQKKPEESPVSNKQKTSEVESNRQQEKIPETQSFSKTPNTSQNKIPEKNYQPAQLSDEEKQVIENTKQEIKENLKTFFEVLPILEKTTRLNEIQNLKGREKREPVDYLPELWEDEGSIIFKKEHNIPFKLSFQEEENSFDEPNKYREEPTIKTPAQKKSVVKKEVIKTEVIEPKAGEKEKSKILDKKILDRAFVAAEKQQKKQKGAEKIYPPVPTKLFTSPSKPVEKKSFTSVSESRKNNQRAIDRYNKQKALQNAKKKESSILEIIKISSMVAGLFLISMVGLNASSILEVTEKYWNHEEFVQKQESLNKLVNTSSEKKENIYANIKSLPVAGKSTNKEEEFDTKMYLNIAPPDTRIIIPKLGKNIPIVSVDNSSREKEQWDKLEEDIQKALREGVVHYPGTAEPGQNGNTFVTGHSSYYPWDDGRYKDVFAPLHDLEEGDEYFIYHKGKKYRYVVSERKVVTPDDVSVLEQDTSKKTSTLMTCTPIGTTARRLILKGEQVEESH